MAYIEKRDSGYRAVISVSSDGKRKKISKSGFKTRQEANIWAYETESKKRDIVRKNKDSLFHIDFHLWYETFKEPTLKTNSKVWYINTEKIIKNYLPDTKTQDLNPFIIQELINSYGKNHVKSSITHIKNNLSAFIRFAVDNGLLEKDFTRSLVVASNKKSKDKDLKFLDKDEMDKLIKQLDQSTSASSAMIYTALMTGARFGELAALNASDFDFKQQLLTISKNYVAADKTVSTPKTRASNRIIEIPKKLIEYLDYYTPGEKWFFEVDGEPLGSAGANKQLKSLLRKAGVVKKLSFHGLRHTHASYLLSQGVDIQYVSERLGHSDIRITLGVYAHLFKEKRSDEVAKTLSLLEEI